MVSKILILYECINDRHVANLAANYLKERWREARISKRHAGGKTRALARLQQELTRGGSDIVVAIVDHDPGQPLPKSLQELTNIIKRVGNNTYYVTRKKNNRAAIVIVLSPELEEWLIKICGRRLGNTDPTSLKYNRRLFEKAWKACEEAQKELKQVLIHALDETNFLRR